MKGTAFSPHESIYIEHLVTHIKNDMPVQHYHDGYEIYLQLDGKRYFFFDNICYQLERGDMLIMKPFEIHSAQSRDSEYYERYVTNFGPDALKPLLSNAELYMLLTERLESCVVRLDEKETETMTDLFRQARDCYKRRGFLASKLTTSAMLLLIERAVDYASKTKPLQGERAANEVIEAIRYINENYRSYIKLDDIADAAGVNKYYLCRRFHATVGDTIFSYLDNVRLKRVHDMLINTGMSLEEIASETGFQSGASLSRVFKKIYGIPPREFRKLKGEQIK